MNRYERILAPLGDDDAYIATVPEFADVHA